MIFRLIFLYTDYINNHVSRDKNLSRNHFIFSISTFNRRVPLTKLWLKFDTINEIPVVKPTFFSRIVKVEFNAVQIVVFHHFDHFVNQVGAENVF